MSVDISFSSMLSMFDCCSSSSAPFFSVSFSPLVSPPPLPFSVAVASCGERKAPRPNHSRRSFTMARETSRTSLWSRWATWRFKGKYNVFLFC